ncbi:MULTISPECIES: cytochrome P450 [Ramlibacter]|uniref:Cytochrome P450 n=1 Tax=Ramlibacter aquaticus TaxID=2780094 RepID=A0ABR9SJJ4_9BURK|nr:MULTISPECIES: cytochrome P450 [Ramlibacter]MBE7942525.1 cytochrome P450 [Ramlibacter aquaticus]
MSEPAARARDWNELPGPPRWPLLGNALQLGGKRMHLRLEDWARRYGKVYRLAIGPRRFFVISDPEAIARVLRNRPEGFKRSARLESVSRRMGFLGLFSANGETWKRQRPMVLGSFDPTHIRDFFPTLVTVTQRLQRRWLAAAQEGRAVDLQAELMLYTVDVTAALAFGEDINTLEAPQAQRIQQHLNQVFPALVRQLFTAFPALQRLQPGRQRELQVHLDAIRAAVQGFIAKTRDKLAAEPALRDKPTNLIQALVAARDRDATLTDEDVSGNVLTMLLAGEDTTANTLAWMTWLLAMHPEAQARARAEARAVLAGRPCADSTEALAEMDYIDACAQEAMRLKPVAPLIGAEAQKDQEVEGVRVRAGELVFCLMRPGAVDEARFGEAQQFRPERWLRGEGDAAQSLNSAKRVVMPFGAGPRMCPGRYLALAEIKMAASMLLANFEIVSVATEDGGAPEEHVSLTMYPAGLRMRLKPLAAGA